MSLYSHVLPIVFTLLLWWFSTGAILYLDGLPRRTFRWSMAGASVVLACALNALRLTANDAGAGAAYVAFASSILVWGWIEMSFLMGFITGPRTTPCPDQSAGWRRAVYAFQAILYHEIALLAGALLVAVATWGGSNRLGVWTFVVLWVSRQSTKLNLFLGVRNLSADFLPDHLRYLQTYFTQRPMNLLFPLSVTVGTIAATALWRSALDPALAAGEATGLSFIATLLTLALLEHWFLILPFSVEALWDWGLRSRRGAAVDPHPVDRPHDARNGLSAAEFGMSAHPSIDATPPA